MTEAKVVREQFLLSLQRAGCNDVGDALDGVVDAVLAEKLNDTRVKLENELKKLGRWPRFDKTGDSVSLTSAIVVVREATQG